MSLSSSHVYDNNTPLSLLWRFSDGRNFYCDNVRFDLWERIFEEEEELAIADDAETFARISASGR